MLKPQTDIERRKALCREILLTDAGTFTLMEETMILCQNLKIQDATGESFKDLVNSFLGGFEVALEKYSPTKGKKKK